MGLKFLLALGLRRRRAARQSWWWLLGWALVGMGLVAGIAVGQPGQATVAQPPDPATTIATAERQWEGEYERYFQRDLPAQPVSPGAIAAKLRQMRHQTGQRSALIYLKPGAKDLEILLLSEAGDPTSVVVEGVSLAALDQAVGELRRTLTDPLQRDKTTYLAPAQELYNALVRPIEGRLQAERIDLLVFCTGLGLRSAPLAALHDGEKFLIERYAIARIPGFSLLDAEDESLAGAQVLAMGTAEFGAPRLVPLPAVPLELRAIVGEAGQRGSWPGVALHDRDFTVQNLQQQRQDGKFRIVHLATHAEFRPGRPSESYIQFWQERLGLDRLADLNWRSPPVSLLVLSACRTAVGDRQVELGFAGLAIDSGAKAALASLWYVSDRGTLGLMNDFYRALRQAPTKSEALRQAQLALLRGQTRVEGNQLRTASARGQPGGSILLPQELEVDRPEPLSHPYYWAAFSIIGNPW